MANRSFRISDELQQQLNAVAALERRSCNFIVNQALESYISAYVEEKKEWEETLAAIEQVERGDTVSSKKIHAWLKSWGKPNEKNRRP